MVSTGMLNTKSLKLEKPKKGDGWGKFVEWNRRWNKILSVIFGILCFSLLFAVVLANILHTDYKNYDVVTTTVSTTTTTTESTTTTSSSTTSSSSTTEEPDPETEPPEPTTALPTTTTELETTTTIDTTTEFFTTATDGPIVVPEETTTTFWTTNSVSTSTTTTVATTTELDPGPPVYTTTTASPSIPPFMTSSQALAPECDSPTCEVMYCSASVENCLITCKEPGSFDESNTSKLINSLLEVCALGSDRIDLVLDSFKFTSNTLSPGWLNIKKGLRSLTTDGKVEKILEGAFDSEVFWEMEELTMKNMQMFTLGSYHFVGLSKLTSLSFYSTLFMTITSDALVNLPNLEVLKLEDNGYKISVVNVTGGVSYPKLRILHLVDSIVKTVEAESFVSAPNLEVINLSNSRITKIYDEAFRGASTKLKTIDLTGNTLTSLPNGIFNNVVKNGEVQIYLADNQWYCDCDLYGLQWIMLNEDTAHNFADNPTCYYPSYGSEQRQITDVDLCGNRTTTSTDITTDETDDPVTPSVVTTSTSTTSSTTKAPETTEQTTVGIPTPTYDTTRKDAEEPTSSTQEQEVTQFVPSYECPEKSDEVPYSRVRVTVMGAHRFNVTEVREGVVVIKIHLNCADEYYNLFWFKAVASNSEEQEEAPELNLSCLPYVDDQLTIDGLIPSAIYTFCLIPIYQFTISPFDCLSLQMRPLKPDQPWLVNRDRMMVFLITCLSLLSVFLLGCIFMYLCLRRGPVLFRRLTKKQPKTSQDLMFMPPLPKRNTKSSISKPLQRSSSDTSIASGRSYVSAINPSPFEVLAWKMDKNRLKAPPVIYNLEKMPNFPPPIPPLPKRVSDTSHYSNLDEIYEGMSPFSSPEYGGYHHYSNYRV